jgi:hypothetical protein
MIQPSRLAFTIFPLVFIASSATAQLLTRDSASFVSTLDQIEGTVSPLSLSTFVDVSSGGIPNIVVNGDGTITMTTPTMASGQFPAFGYDDPVDHVSSSTGWTWETRFRIDAANDPSRSVWEIYFRDRDSGSVAATRIHFLSTGIDRDSDGSGVDAGIPFDLTDGFHTVRTAVTPANLTSVWIDDQLMIDGLVSSSVSANEFARIGRWGTQTGGGVTTIDYIRFDTTGAFAPTAAVDPTMRLEVDRMTGGLKLINKTGENRTITGYRIASEFEALNPTNGVWTSITDTADFNSGRGFDPLKNWLELTPASGRDDLSEVQQPGGSGVTMANNQMFNLGSPWIHSSTEDLTLEVLLLDGTVETGRVVFVGNGGHAFALGDLDGLNGVGPDDWEIFRSHHGETFTGLSLAEAYQLGDLDRDRRSTIRDFVLFKTAYDQQNGPGAASALFSGVPEPSAILLLLATVPAIIGLRSQYRIARGASPGRPAPLGITTSTSLSHVLTKALCIAAFVAATALNFSSPALAQLIPRDSTAFVSTLAQIEGDANPLSLGSFSDVSSGGAPSYTVNGDGTLTLVTPDMASGQFPAIGYNAPTNKVSSSTGWTWETRFRIDAANDPNRSVWEIYFRDRDSGSLASTRVHFLATGIDRDTAGFGVDAEVPFDFTDDFHTVRAAVTPDNFTSLWIDSEQVIDGLTSSTFSGDEFLRIGRWGSQSAGGTTTIDYIRFDTTGAYAPTNVLPTYLSLEVNTTNGIVKLVNETNDAIEIDSYQIVSEHNPGALNSVGWNSFEEQDALAFPAGDGSGNGWEQGDGSSSNLLVESFLDGFSSVEPGAVISLGNAFVPSVFGVGVDADLAFEYHIPGQPNTVNGIVKYITSTAVAGDYNGDGVVNAADYTVWRNSLGQTVTPGSGADGSSNGVIDTDDYTFWKGRFGATSGSAALGSASVPEPSSALCLAIGITAAILVRRNMTRSVLLLLAIAISLASTRESSAAEAFPLDREYKFGDDSQESGIPSNDVGVNFGGSFYTFDSVGNPTDSQPGSYQDLTRFGNPKYAVVSDRPYFAAGVGIAFDGDGDYLRGDNLNDPASSKASIGYNDDPGNNPANTPGRNNYNGIFDRQFQLWVKPDPVDAANTNKTQSIVMDSNQHGLQIVNGKWSMRYAGTDYTTNIPVDTSANNGWSHVMVARPAGSPGGSRLYINGQVVAAASGNYSAAAHEELVVGSNTSRDVSNNFNGGTANYFHGVLDNLTMTLIGHNTAQAGPPVGMINSPFSFGSDNEYAVNFLSAYSVGDLTRDSNVTGDGSGLPSSDDVAAFIANWEFEQTINGIRVGDINSRLHGDFDFDGFVGLSDWNILRTHHVDAAALNLGALLAGNYIHVPEPATGTWLALSLAVLVGARTRRFRI